MHEFDQRIVLVCSSISNCYAYHAWHFRVEPALAKIQFWAPYARGAVEVSTLIASLVMLRRMHDFLSGERKFKDDFICRDLELAKRILLTDGEMKDVNKRVVHLTTVTEFDENFDRNLLALYQRTHPIFETLLQELLEKFGGSKDNQFEIQQTIDFINEMNNEMEAAAS